MKRIHQITAPNKLWCVRLQVCKEHFGWSWAQAFDIIAVSWIIQNTVTVMKLANLVVSNTDDVSDTAASSYQIQMSLVVEVRGTLLSSSTWSWKSELEAYINLSKQINTIFLVHVRLGVRVTVGRVQVTIRYDTLHDFKEIYKEKTLIIYVFDSAEAY